MVRRKCLCSPNQKIKTSEESKKDDSYEVRVEGRSKKGFISFKCKLRELMLPRVGSLKKGICVS